MKNRNGIGINATAMNAKIEMPHSIPIAFNNGPMNSGKAPARTDLRNVFAATALAAYRWKVSMR